MPDNLKMPNNADPSGAKSSNSTDKLATKQVSSTKPFPKKK